MQLKRSTIHFLKPRAWRLLPFWYHKHTCQNGCCIDVEVAFLFMFTFESKVRNFELVDLLGLPRDDDNDQPEEKPHAHLH